MLVAPCSIDEPVRQQALDEMDLVDTPAEHYLDTLVRLTRELFHVETVLISLIDRDRQWFKARIGLEAEETPRDISFCGHAVAARAPLVVEDAHLDDRFVDNPLVTGAPFIRFYAGQPLYSRNGQPIGTLCILDPTPRQLGQEERFHLQDLGTLVEGYLQLRNMSQQTQRLRQAVDREQRKALIDPLTQLWNRAGLNQFYPRELESAQALSLRLGAIFCDLDHFKQVNDKFGHAGGDQVLWESARRMAAALRPEDLLVRLGGEEFVALVNVRDNAELRIVAERLRQTICDKPVLIGQQAHELTVSVGVTLAEPGDNQTTVLERADRALYQAKQGGRNRVILAVEH